ncbi:ras association domain-containing protein 4 isoform X2 [Hydra vulgaris]
MPTPVQLSAVERKLKQKNGSATVKRSKSFNSTSAPTSPNAVKKTKQPSIEPNYTKSTYLLFEAKRLAKELEERKKNGVVKTLSRPFLSKIHRNRSNSNCSSISSETSEPARCAKKNSCDNLQLPLADIDSSSFSSSRNKRKNLVALPQNNKMCAECQEPLISGSYSEHQGYVYCNVPCYTSLFSTMVSKENDSCSSLSRDQKLLRASLIPKLRTYNSYYAGTPCQICCKEINDKFVLEGVLKVYWGLKSAVTLDNKIPQPHYWKHLSNEYADENNENDYLNVDDKKLKMASAGIRPSKNDISSRYAYKRKPCSENSSKKRIGCSVCNGACREIEKCSSFIPPYGTPTTLRITNHVRAPQLIDMLFKKFQITDERKKYTLFTLFESGGQRRITPDAYPLLTRLHLGPCEDVAKIFIMESADQTDIPLEVAQYINFSNQVLDTFIKKFYEEEEREVYKIKEKYEEYRSLLIKRLSEFKKNNVQDFEE